MILPQGVHNLMGAWTSVVDVAKNVQLVDGQTLDDITDGTDEIICSACRDDGIDNNGNVCGFVDIIGTFMQQFLNDIGEVFWQRLTHLRTCIFR